MTATRSVFVVDYFFDRERQENNLAGPRAFAKRLRDRGRHVDEIYAFCVADAVIGICRDLQKQEDRTKKIDVLRFYGHGGPGMQNVGGNQDMRNDATLLTVKDGELLHRASLVKILPLLTRKSRIELHGCEAAAGNRGEKLLVKLADLLRVEVWAAPTKQYSLNSKLASKFEGTVVYALPGMKSVFTKALE